MSQNTRLLNTIRGILTEISVEKHKNMVFRVIIHIASLQQAPIKDFKAHFFEIQSLKVKN